MTVTERNELFLQYQGLIWYTIRKNSPLINALRLNYNDVAQDLSLRALRAIEKYDESRGKSLKGYILDELQYEILSINAERKRPCRVANVNTVSLDAGYPDDDEGDEKTIDIPVVVEYDGALITQELINTLDELEKEVLFLKMDGYELTNARQLRLMDRIQRKTCLFYATRNRRVMSWA